MDNQKKQITEQTIKVKLMHCTGCEGRIESGLRKLAGVIHVQASYRREEVKVSYNPQLITLHELYEKIDSLGYRAERRNIKNKSVNKVITPIQLVIVAVAAYLLLKNTGVLTFIPEIDPSMGYGLLFVTGLLVSLHCITMCGGINLSQSLALPKDDRGDLWVKLKPGLLYNGGRILSYTVLGGMVGAVGSLIGFTGGLKGIVAIVSGVLMILIGFNMLDLFAWLRRLIPAMPKKMSGIISDHKAGPFFVGLLNGFMPCGPLQAMQMYALGTGSFVVGAASMLMFGLGTVPLMLLFGALGSLISRNFSRKMIKASGVFILILGMVMFNRGMTLSGVSLFPHSGGSGESIAQIENGIQVVTSEINSGSYEPITVYQGVPVRWIIKADAKDLNRCNNPIIIPEYGLEITLKPGENIVEFTPERLGTIPYSCWMGMISSSIKIIEN